MARADHSRHRSGNRGNNRGETGLTGRKRREDPMLAYDRLPPELRAWLREARLPWSPHSCRRIWTRARKAGRSPQDALAWLDQVEQATLARHTAGTFTQ